MNILKRNRDEIYFEQNKKIQAKRKEAWNIFCIKNFPNKKNEIWRYNNLPLLYQAHHIDNIKLKVNNEVLYNEFDHLLSSDNYNIILIDGQLIYLDNVTGLCIENIINKEQMLLNYNLEDDRDAIDVLNFSSILGGVYLNLKNNIKLMKPIMISYINSYNSHSMLLNYRNHINIGKNSECCLYEQFVSLNQTKSIAINIYSNIELSNNVNYTYDQISENSMKKLLITNNINVKMYKNAYFDTFHLSSFSPLNHIIFNVNLIDKGSKFIAKGLYALSEKNRSDYHFNINHFSSYTESNINFRGIFGGYSSGTFNAKAFIDKKLNNIKIIQTNKNIQISKHAEINSKPELVINSDDVICKHGVTIGQINTDTIYYLRSRGLLKDQAILLLIQNFSKILIKVLKRDKKTLNTYNKKLEIYLKPILN